ncbi:beta transducin-like protein HET-E4s [Macroventuria anomochaeta]|uniref:Beta transducin-like protein HET-E4s n=1 Tax=Macroventuria anomochaeta TaxID=301207 RepID=A0ACB6RU55_9PLEO|nr:beta transducin-like protein HET-E4s [Macroventuria anomochaeta]KAF2625515.1 beta transducin-like protein HET-E4s [Macroventuria anomochaeta]
MRLLRYDEQGELGIVSFDDGATPPYAILSHTWGVDTEEVTFADLQKGDGKTKPGHEKILFCAKQAQRDNLQYFWIDTCCIDKANKAELALSIRSMFHWYRNAARCYVYLSDVSNQPLLVTPGHHDSRWFLWIWTLSILYTLSRWSSSVMHRYFYPRHVARTPVGSGVVRSKQTPEFPIKESRWFTRGWTLQELLAPSTVEFFSKEGAKLGDKLSLAKEVREVTGIPCSALQGEPLSDFSVNERISWNEHRVTKIPTDRAYSLMGILGVSLSPFDGESPAEAMKRVTDEAEKQDKCLRDIHQTDPRNDKKRIEDTKGGLLADSYRWVLANPTFQQWQQRSDSRLLWMKGDPGKGKTMLLCGIIDELHNSMPRSALLSYFFCQATDPRINSATAVLRGLLYMLIHQQPSLVSHVCKKHDHAGKALFEDANAWVALTEIFTNVLQDPQLRSTYLIVDALDECVTDLSRLLHFIAKQSSASFRVKWIVSSRNWPEIEEQLDQDGHKARLSLELNAESVSAAVGVFIQHKVTQLAQQKNYDRQMQDMVLERLAANADGTFLWVALVCQELRATARRNVLKKLDTFPPGLKALYERMMQQISASDDAILCKQVLASAALVYRPITLQELVALAEPLEDIADEAEVRETIGLCGSFLTLREDTVYFVHQSAKDFLFASAYNEVFPQGAEVTHHVIFSRSLAILSKTLRRDVYSLKTLGTAIKDVQPPEPDPFAASRYSCVYWIDHLYDSKPEPWADSVGDIEVAGAVDEFMRKKYLYWLEGLSLCRSMSKGVISMAKLYSLAQAMQDSDELTKLIQDARRFVMYHKGVIESYPLQTYASALLFSPTGSMTRRLFQHEEPNGIVVRPAVSTGWSACLQTLEGHSSYVTSVAFSHDSSKLASALEDNTVKVWDASSGACLQTLEGHSGEVSSVAFSHDSSKLASGSYDNTVKIGACLQTLEGHSSYVMSVAFSHDSSKLASASYDNTVKVWDASSGACLQTLNIGKALYNLSFDPTSSFLRFEIGPIAIHGPGTSSEIAVVEPACPQYCSASLSSDSIWIKYGGRNMLWIPSEYRPSCSAVCGNTVGMGVGSGRVWTCTVDPDTPVCS